MLKEARNRSVNVNRMFFPSARNAFLYLLKILDFKDGEFILMPSYIGQSAKEGSGVFDPIRKLNIPYKFYSLNADLSVGLEDIKKHGGKIKAVFIIHYFGFPQPKIQEIADYCNEHNIVLIEDCAHSFSSSHEGINIGSFGDYALLSIHKIFPTEAGGVLQINKNNILVDSDDKIAFADLEQFAKSDLSEISKKRRANYVRYLRDLKDSKHLEIFHKKLPDGCVPLNLPILIKGLDRFEVYKKLVEKDVACVSLWYDLINEIGAEFVVSHQISSQILNLPVHQDIVDEDIDEVIKALKEEGLQ